LAIGAAIASGPYLALSLLIGIQNVSEGIASYREMMTGRPTMIEVSDSTICCESRMDIMFNNDNQRTKYYYYFDLASIKTEK
jgi:hypothetical protein